MSPYRLRTRPTPRHIRGDPDVAAPSTGHRGAMRIALLVLAGIGAIVVLTGVVLPVLGWLIGTLAWVAAGALVIGGGVWAYRRMSGSRSPSLGSGTNGRQLP